MKPETDLVVRCLRAFLRPKEIAHLRTALAQALEWKTAENAAASMGVAPIFAAVLVQHAPDLIPQETLASLQGTITRTAQRNLLWLREWQRLLQAFEEAGITVISFKGPALALAAYGNLALRDFSDLDLLVRPGDVVGARNTLALAGYALWSPTVQNTDEALTFSKNHQLCFTHSEHGTAVDLHWGLLHEMFPFQLDVDGVFNAARIERCEGTSFLSLSPEYSLLYLSAHGTKNCWLRLSDLSDLAAYLRERGSLDWEKTFRIARTNRSDRVLKHALLLAERVLGIELPHEGECCRDDHSAIVLSIRAEDFLFSDRSGGPGYWAALRYHLEFANTWRNRMRLVLDRVFVPAEPDWERVRLPQRLQFLYYVVRPLRFFQGQISRVVRSSR